VIPGRRRKAGEEAAPKAGRGKGKGKAAEPEEASVSRHLDELRLRDRHGV
jgi:hypothetical protein